MHDLCLGAEESGQYRSSCSTLAQEGIRPLPEYFQEEMEIIQVGVRAGQEQLETRNSNCTRALDYQDIDLSH